MSINKQKVPKIRFEGFSDTWVNQTLDSLVDESIRWGFTGGPFGSDLKSEDYTDSGIRVIQLQNIGDGEFLNTHKIYVSEDKANDLISCNIYPNEILISKMGDPVARCCLVPQYHSRYVMCSDGIRLVVNKEKYNNFYVFQAINQTIFRKKAISVSTGSTRKRIGLSELRSLSLMIPKLEEQTQIGNFFQQIDKLIELQTRAVETAETYKKAMLQKMFPQKGEKVPRVRFEGFSGDWEEKKVGEIFRATRGQVLAVNLLSESKTEKYCYPVYSSQTKDNGLLGYYFDFLFEDSITWTTDGANAGTVKFRKGKFYSTNVNGVLLSEAGYSNQMVAEYLNTVAYKYVSRVGNPKLMNNVMVEIPIILPKLKEQTAIGNFFQKLDQQIEQQRQKLATYQQLKKAMLQRMFV